MPATHLAIALVQLCLSSEGADTRDTPSSRFPLVIESGLSDCSEGCFAADPSGALICLEHREAINCGTCMAAWFGPGDPPDKAPEWTPLSTCTQNTVRVHKAAIAAVNHRARQTNPIARVFGHMPWESGKLNPGRGTAGDVTFELTADTLRVLRGETLIDSVSWLPATRKELAKDESVSVAIYRLGKGWLANISYLADPVGASSPSRWVRLGLGRDKALDPTPLAPDPSLESHCPEPPDNGEDENAKAACPPSYASLTPYLEHYCANTLTRGHLAALEQLASGVDLHAFFSADALVALFNMHGAMYGYTFKQEPQLNAFYYGPTPHLPEACRALVKRYPRAADVPASFTEGRDVARRLWQAKKR